MWQGAAGEEQQRHCRRHLHQSIVAGLCALRNHLQTDQKPLLKIVQVGVHSTSAWKSVCLLLSSDLFYEASRSG